MPEHFTRNTLECTAYCGRCQGFTQHRVDGGRRGPCLSCITKRNVEVEADRIRRGLEQEQQAERDRQNPRLFE